MHRPRAGAACETLASCSGRRAPPEVGRLPLAPATMTLPSPHPKDPIRSFSFMLGCNSRHAPQPNLIRRPVALRTSGGVLRFVGSARRSGRTRRVVFTRACLYSDNVSGRSVPAIKLVRLVCFF
ncbi:hypothetical protein EVAR_51026_1 [Eumeta japonica]|uniref:Uncharacterized protein n=1 Tax=Eumeta variegata TaxID=151549 RepID=A0A4C1Y857_EUMVA|nr:hypothetical protein EVAR_51026_1 [Eumeta japonica]